MLREMVRSTLVGPLWRGGDGFRLTCSKPQSIVLTTCGHAAFSGGLVIDDRRHGWRGVEAESRVCLQLS